MKKLQEVRNKLRPGQVYRREDLAKWSTSVDRHLKELVASGDLVKLSGGIMDTHSREADARMELLMAAAYRAGCAPDTLGKILDCLVTEEALAYIAKDGCLSATMELLMKKILFYLKKRVKEELRVECILYANGYGELARSDGAVELLERIREEEEHLQ